MMWGSHGVCRVPHCGLLPCYFPQGGSEPLNGSTHLGHPTCMWYFTRHHMAHRPRGGIGPRWERGWRQWGCHTVESVASSDRTGSAYVRNAYIIVMSNLRHACVLVTRGG
jgi:hypothetical protein